MSVLKEIGTPIFYAEGEPYGVTRENYRLYINGLVEEQKTFTFQDIENMPARIVNARLTSVSGWSVRASWQGVRFSDFFKYISIKPKAKFINFRSFGEYTTCLPFDDLLRDNVLLCYKVDGEYLEDEYGGPLRTVVPHLWGYKSIKGLEVMTFTDIYIPGFWETKGYSDSAEIEPGETLDINSGRKRPIKGGEVIEF